MATKTSEWSRRNERT